MYCHTALNKYFSLFYLVCWARLCVVASSVVSSGVFSVQFLSTSSVMVLMSFVRFW
jgi:hypothetical protein